VIAIVVSGKGPVAFDAGRAAQNMVLAAWNEGVVCCPNAITNPESLTELLGLEADVQVPIVLSFGYAGRPQARKRAHPRSRSAGRIAGRSRRSRGTCRGARPGDGPLRGPGRAGARRA
jgi:nitroreductase